MPSPSAFLRGPWAVALAVMLFFLGWPGALSTLAASEDGFSRGNRFYAAGKFPEAAAAYEAQVHQGDYHANLFYNLGDAYYRVGDRGHAILNYRRALLLEPSHTEAAANLAFVSGTLPTPLPNPDDHPSEDLISWLTAAAGWLAAAGVLMAIFLRRQRKAGTLLAFAGLLVLGLGASDIWWTDHGKGVASRALVVTDGAPALYSPADNSKVIRKLPLGDELRVVSAQGAWVYAALADGTRAWVASDKLQRLVPGR